MKPTLIVILAFLWFSQAKAQGKYLALGGARIDSPVLDKLSEEIGGKDNKIIFVPTAFCWSEDFSNSWYLQALNSYGFTNVEILHTRDRSLADDEEFSRGLLTAKAIFFGGGCPECLTASYLNTNFHKNLKSFSKKGGVIVGISAGAEALSSIIEERCEGEIEKGIGLGLIEHLYFGVHIDADNRFLANMKNTVSNHQNLVGVGIPEGAGVFINNGNIQSIGDGSIIWTKSGLEIALNSSKEYSLNDLR